MSRDALAVVTVPAIAPALLAFLAAPPIPALVLSGVGLLLARAIAPPALRQLSAFQHACLTMLLLLILGLLVSGQFTGSPLAPGPATLLGVGLGLSGLVAVELFAEQGMLALRMVTDRGMAALRALLGKDSA